ncbi:Ubiquitin carboxyl-terminal hydrolase MINDY-1, partial [Clydaea vesicula]
MNETNSNGIKLERNEDEIKEVVNQSETDSKNESNKKSVPFQQPLVDSNDVKDVNYLKPKKKILSQDIDSYQVKQISFFGQLFNIVLQNLNGPCPLIALINVLSLTKKINIPPIPTTSEKLLDKLNGYLLDGNLNLSESDLLKVLKELPNLKTGMIVSPRFDIPMSFVDSDQLLVFKAF